MSQAKTAAPKPGGTHEYDEERIPFDDVMRTLLKAKPQHKPAAKPVKAPAKKK